MKKILFTAIAMVAFAGTSFAANEVVEKVTVVSSDTPCADQWSKDYEALREAGYSHNTSVAIANADFEDCLDTNYPVDDVAQTELKLSKS